MTPLQARIAEELRTTNFDVALVSHRLNVAEVYVNQVAEQIKPTAAVVRTVEKAGRSEATTAGPLAPVDRASTSVALGDQTAPPGLPADWLTAAIIPQNQEGVVALRDSAIERLKEHFENEDPTPALAVRVLRLILEHEAQLRAIARPMAAIGVGAQVNNFNINVLVQKLEKMDRAELRGLVGVPEPMVIDLPVKEV